MADHHALDLVFHDRRIDFRAKDEDDADDIEEDQRDHDRGEARIGRNVGGEGGKIGGEDVGSNRPGDQRQDDARQHIHDLAASVRQPEMANDQAGGQHDEDADEAPAVNHGQKRIEPRQIGPGIADGERYGDKQDADDGKNQHARQNEGKTGDAGLVPPAAFGHPVGAIEGHAERLDTVGGEIGSSQHRHGQQPASRYGQNPHHLIGNRLGDRVRPRIEDEMHRCRCKLIGPQKTTERGTENQERKDRQRVESATWLAMAQPSSSLKCQTASKTTFQAMRMKAGILSPTV